jgi:hypothetical protein
VTLLAAAHRPSFLGQIPVAEVCEKVVDLLSRSRFSAGSREQTE